MDWALYPPTPELLTYVTDERIFLSHSESEVKLFGRKWRPDNETKCLAFVVHMYHAVRLQQKYFHN